VWFVADWSNEGSQVLVDGKLKELDMDEYAIELEDDDVSRVLLATCVVVAKYLSRSSATLTKLVMRCRHCGGYYSMRVLQYAQ
jgi:hypothetical protein